MIHSPVLSFVLSLTHKVVNLGVDGFQVLSDRPMRAKVRSMVVHDPMICQYESNGSIYIQYLPHFPS